MILSLKVRGPAGSRQLRHSQRHNYRDPRTRTVATRWNDGNWLAALDDFRNWLIREAA
jgi:hypothetical protein